MKNIHRKIYVRMLAAMLVTVAIIILSALAAHAPAQNQTSLTLESIRTDNTAVFYADHRANGAWFVEAVLPAGDKNASTENLSSVVATL